MFSNSPIDHVNIIMTKQKNQVLTLIYQTHVSHYFENEFDRQLVSHVQSYECIHLHRHSSKIKVFRMSKITVILQHRFNNFSVFRSKFITPLHEIEKVSSFLEARSVMLYIKPGKHIHIQDESCNSVQLLRTILVGHV